MQDMDFRQLEALVNTINYGSFSKAAEAIFVSQPSVSMYISSLEKELGCQLIFRSTKAVLPTKAGKIVYDYAQNMLSLRDKTIYSVKSMSDSLWGEIQIAATPVAAQCILPAVLAQFHKSYSHLSFHLSQGSTDEVVRSVTSRKSDLGIVSRKGIDDKCRYEQFISDDLVLIMPNKEIFHAFTPMDVIDILHEEDFLMVSETAADKVEYEDLLKELAMKKEDLNVCSFFPTAQSVINGVIQGMGVSIVSRIAAADSIEQGKLIAIPLDMDISARNFYLVFPSDLIIPHTLEIFIDFLRLHFGDDR